MLFNSVQFLVFFPAVVLLYFAFPHKVRYLWLLAASYYFYMCWNPKYALLMATSTLITYASGLLIERVQSCTDAAKAQRLKKMWVALSFASNLSILFFFKYYDFALGALQRVFGAVGIALQVPAFDVLLPVGISFYTFQALSYTMDVYRGDVRAEKNVLKYALFVSFFPQLVAGPIERSKNLLQQIDERHSFDYNRMKRGLLRMLYGLFQKLVIADRVAILVTQVFDNYREYAGFQIALAALLFAVQIYCDFGGYSNIAIGAAQVMGFRLMENFRQPYLAVSIQDFWNRWHISLSTWFRDYLYFPLGGSRKGKWRTYCNTMLVFLASGLWHGASWNYVVWGGVHGALKVGGSLTAPARAKLRSALKIETNTLLYVWWQRLCTFAMVDLAWVFFRANGTAAALGMLRNLFAQCNVWIFTDGSLYTLGLEAKDFWLAMLAIGVMFCVDLCRERGVGLYARLQRQNIFVRWGVYYAAIFSVILFGIYGIGYDASQFIYFQF